MKKISLYFLKYIYTPVKRSVRLKLMIMMLFLVLGPLLMVTSVAYINSKSAMEQAILRQNASKMTWVKMEIVNNIERIDEALTAFFFDDNIKFYLSKITETNNLRVSGISYFRDKIRSFYLANYQDFELVRFYVFDQLKSYSLTLEDGFQIKTLEENFRKNTPSLISDSLFVYEENELSGTRVLNGPYLKKTYHRFEDHKMMSSLVVRLKWNLFEKAIDLLNTEPGNEIYFVDLDGNLLQGHYSAQYDRKTIENVLQNIQGLNAETSSLEEMGNELMYKLLNGKYVFYEQVNSQIVVIKTIPKSYVTHSYVKTLNMQLVIVLVTSLLVVIITIYLGIRVTNPLLLLSCSMQNVKELITQPHKNYESIVKSHDELRILEQSYMFMLETIEQLINQEYKQKIELQSAQLMALQAQINPHFMYNTLQMIGGMAIEKNVTEIYDIIGAFSNMLRYNMRLGENIVTVSEELTNLNDYLKIQKMRFDQEMEICIDVDPQILNDQIPKMTLQPIVENCYKHGFIKKQSTWKIAVSIRYDNVQDADHQQKKGVMLIQVMDNGQGITTERLVKIREDLKTSTDTIFNTTENLGLKNIDSRIKLNFGKIYGLDLSRINDSVYTTCVTVRLLCKEVEGRILNDTSNFN